jgi:hypothetical protein
MNTTGFKPLSKTKVHDITYFGRDAFLIQSTGNLQKFDMRFVVCIPKIGGVKDGKDGKDGNTGEDYQFDKIIRLPPILIADYYFGIFVIGSVIIIRSARDPGVIYCDIETDVKSWVVSTGSTSSIGDVAEWRTYQDGQLFLWTIDGCIIHDGIVYHDMQTISQYQAQISKTLSAITKSDFKFVCVPSEYIESYRTRYDPDTFLVDKFRNRVYYIGLKCIYYSRDTDTWIELPANPMKCEHDALTDQERERRITMLADGIMIRTRYDQFWFSINHNCWCEFAISPHSMLSLGSWDIDMRLV